MLDFQALKQRNLARHGYTRLGWERAAFLWGTVNLSHADAPDFDADLWLDYARACHLDAVSWSAGGIWATYPTELPHHPTLRGLWGDPLGELVDGSRALGLAVTARVDHHALTSEVADAKPDWVMRDENGAPRAHWAAPELVLACALGDYNARQMSDVLRELAARYGVDGFNHNRWHPQGMCYCAWCRQHYQNDVGEALPREGEAGENWKRYFVWREARLIEIWDAWNAAVREINSHAFVLPGVIAGAGMISLAKLRPRARTLYLDYQGRKALDAPWQCGRGGKEVRAALGEGKPVGMTFSVGVEAGWPRWKDSTQSGAELRVWIAQAWAHGIRPKWAKFDGAVRDARWMPVVAEAYAFAARNHRFLRDARSLARIALVVSPSSARFGPPGDYERATRGWHQALVEARLPFDCAHEEFLDQITPDRYRALVLPDCSCLSDAACEALRGYVARGGSLVATHRSSLCDELGHARADFGLADLFGVSYAGRDERLVNAYLHVVDASHPLLDKLEAGATRPVAPTARARVRATAEFDAPALRWIEPYPDLPMEEVFPRAEMGGESEGVPALWARQTEGGGRVVYYPGNLDATFWDYLTPDHGALLAGAAEWACGAPAPARVTGQGLLDVTIARSGDADDDFLALHVVNLTNPFAQRGPMREIFAVGPLEIEIDLPADFMPRSARWLRADQDAEFRVENGVLKATLARVEEHEALVVMA